MSDLISRQAAIDAIDKITWYHQNANKDMVSGANSAEHQAWFKAEDVYKALESVPDAEPEPSDDIDNALALLDAIHSSGRMEYYSDYCVLHDAISQISAQPERNKGEWIETEFLKLRECSCCHVRWGMYDVENFNFCPNCGADMRSTERNSNV